MTSFENKKWSHLNAPLDTQQTETTFSQPHILRARYIVLLRRSEWSAVKQGYTLETDHCGRSYPTVWNCINSWLRLIWFTTSWQAEVPHHQHSTHLKVPISQCGSYSALFGPLHSSINKEQHENNPCNPSSHYGNMENSIVKYVPHTSIPESHNVSI